MRHCAQGATGGWVMAGLVFQWFPLCEFSLFDTPWGQFSGSLGSWSQCSHSKGSGLDLEFCVGLYILFCWSGPVRSQLVFCMHLCVWRCIPDVSVERDIFHVHLLLHHLVPLRAVLFLKDKSLVHVTAGLPISKAWLLQYGQTVCAYSHSAG